MAKIIYALSGQGRGHASRVMAISDALRVRGHDISFCCGGTAREILSMKGEPVIEVPALRQVMDGNEFCLLETIRSNWESMFSLGGIVTDLAETFVEMDPDLVITDFEAFSHRAADRIGVPVISFNHQEVVTKTTYSLPLRYRWDAMLTELAIRLIVPAHPELTLITSFFYPPLRTPSKTMLIPPIVRPTVQRATATRGEHVLVYYNDSDGADHVLQTLRAVDASFVVYNFDRPESARAFPNVRFKKPCIDEFLEDLASSRAVISTAGFTLSSEALFLGKPLLVVPNRGIFEQTLNALFLKRDGLGDAIIDRPLTVDDVTDFLANQSRYEKKLRAYATCGNDQAIACIERVLNDTLSPPSRARLRTTATAGAAAIGRFD